MNGNMETEKELSLKDMLYCALRKWRQILNVAIIIALLAGGYRLYRGLHVVFNDQAAASAQNKYEIAQADYEAKGERLRAEMTNLQEQSARQQEYNEKSVLMKIDPMNKWEGYFQLYIDSKFQINPSLSYQNVDLTNRLVSAYASFLRSGELYQELLEQSPDIEEIRFLKEVYSVSADPANATIMVRCVGAEEADVREMLDFIKTKIATQFETIQDAIGDHGYDILSEFAYSTIDLDLDETQKANLLAITDYSNKIGETSEQLTAWEKQEKPKQEFGVWYSVKQAIKRFIIGGVVGVVLTVIWLCLKYAMSNTMKTDDDWKQYGLPVLGRIVRGEKPRKLLPCIDRLIDRIFDREKKATTEQSCALAAQNLSAVIRKRGLDKGTMIGHLPDKMAETLEKKLEAAGAGVGFRYAGDVLENPSAVGNLEGTGEVLLLAERYATHCADVEQTLTLLKAWGKTILGVVVVE